MGGERGGVWTGRGGRGWVGEVDDVRCWREGELWGERGE